MLSASKLGPYFLYETTRSRSQALLWQAEPASNLDADSRPSCSGSRRTGKFARCAIISRYEQSLLYNDGRGSDLSKFFRFDDENFCRQFVDLLKHHYGEPLTAIGDLEVV